MALTIHALMRSLAQARPVFHSEADFQFALAWRIREQMPNCTVRLEYKPLVTEALYLDIWIPTLGTAIELKYKTRRLLALLPEHAELYSLKNHGAYDHARYDFLADLRRLERIVNEHEPAKHGLAVLLTNDRNYWDAPTGERKTDDAEFRLHEGREFSGTLSWAHKDKLDAKGTRKRPLVLSGSYSLNWHDYSDNATTAADVTTMLDDSMAERLRRHSRFRYLIVAVGD